MQEFDQVMHAANACQQACVLAMVVNTSGSTYRRAGAVMLIRKDGSMVGAVSGGCVEKEIVRQSQRVFASGQALLIEYDGRYTLGCNGSLFILLELFDPPDRQALFNHYHSALRSRQQWTVIANFQDDVPGVALTFGPDQLFLVSSAGNSGNRLAEFHSRLQSGFSCSAEPGWFRMQVQSSRRICIIGSELDAVKLALLATELGYLVQLVAHPRNPEVRPEQQSLITLINNVVVAPEDLATEIPVDQQTAVVLMTHSYSRDLAYLKALVAAPCLTYLGMVGPKQRSNELLAELLDSTSELPHWFDHALRAPAGLDIGGEIPAEVALAILAEVQMVFAGYAGGALSEKPGSIHRPREAGKAEEKTPGLTSSG